MPKVHMAYWPRWVIGGCITLCGPNPMFRDVPLTADWSEVTCKGCQRLKDHVSDPDRQAGLEAGRRALAKLNGSV